MRQPFLFMDLGHGWQNMTGHQGSATALASFSIDWGTNQPTSQPDPSVLSFKLIDRTGELAGNSTRLAGAKVLIQLTRMPQWSDLTDPTDWQHQPDIMDWNGFHLAHRPDPTQPPDPTALTIFKGSMATGNSIEQSNQGTYKLSLHANGDLVRASRTTQQGPTSSDPALAGKHWTLSTKQRIDEVQQRLISLGCPPLSETTVTWLNHAAGDLAPYELSSWPDLSTVLHSLASASPDIPLFYETHQHGIDQTEAWLAGAPSSISLHSDGTLTAESGGRTQAVLAGNPIKVDAHTLTLPEPVSKVTVKGKKVKWDQSQGALIFEDAQIDFTDQGRLPPNLKETIKSSIFESDAIIADESQGHWHGQVWRPTDAQRSQWAEWIKACTIRLRPQKLTVTSAKADIDLAEQNLQPAPSLYAFISNRYTRLLSDDGTPATSGVWMAIGGTLSFTWAHDRPILSNEINLWPMPTIPSQISRWQDLAPITLAWNKLAITWGEFSQITYFQQ